MSGHVSQVFDTDCGEASRLRDQLARVQRERATLEARCITQQATIRRLEAQLAEAQRRARLAGRPRT